MPTSGKRTPGATARLKSPKGMQDWTCPSACQTKHMHGLECAISPSLIYLTLYATLLKLAVQTLALGQTFRTPDVQSTRLNISVAEPQPLRCFDDDDIFFPVSTHVCNPILDQLYERRGSGRYFTIRGLDGPKRFGATGTPCAITLDCHSSRDEDRFTYRDIAQHDLLILEECEFDSLGGVAPMGSRGFFLRVDGGFEARIRPAGHQWNATSTE